MCAAPWTRIRSDVSEAVPLTAPSIPSAGRVRATGSEDSVDVRAAGFGSGQTRPTSALCLGLGLRVGPRTRAVHGPTALRWWPRGGGASRSVEAEPSLLLGWAAGAARATGAARGRRVGGSSLAGHGARQAARRARKTAERRAASLGRRLRRLDRVGGPTRLGSTDSVRFPREWR